jgi:hypothetical protein
MSSDDRHARFGQQGSIKMAERRTRVYLGRQQQRRDEAEATAHGWSIVSRDSGPEGYRVTYELRSAWGESAAPRPRGVRPVTWLLLIWNLVLLPILLVRIVNGGYLGDSIDASITTMSHSSLLVTLGLVWFVGLLVISVLWLRGRA